MGKDKGEKNKKENKNKDKDKDKDKVDKKAQRKAEKEARHQKSVTAKGGPPPVPKTHDDNGQPYRPPFDAEKFQAVLSQCRLQWPTEPKYNPTAVRQGKFHNYAHSDFCLTPEGHLSMAMKGSGRRCELRHNNHWSISDAKGQAQGIYLTSSVALPEVDDSRIDSFTFFQIHTHEFKDKRDTGKKYAAGPFLRLVWKRKRGKKKDFILANVREDLKCKGKSNEWYDLDFPRPTDGSFFDVHIAVIYNDDDSQHYELKVDINGTNRLTKTIDYWEPIASNYFKAGAYLGSGVDDDKEPCAKVLFQTLEIGIPGSDSDTCKAPPEESEGGESSDDSDDSD